MADALVLGAGIMGLSAAWALREAGHRVTVLEAGEVPNPRGASVDEHRLIRHAYGAATGYMRMVDEAYAAWEALFAAIGERPYVETGVLALAGEAGPGAPEEGDWLGASQDALRGHWQAPGSPALASLPPALLPSLYPWLRAEGLSRAFRTPRGGVLLARRIVAALARHLAASGVAFRRGRAAAVDPERARLRLEDGAALAADHLVLAAGPWAPRLLGLAPRVRPSRQVVVFLEPPPALRAAWAAAPMVLDLSGRGGFYAVPPVAGTRLKVGDHRFSLTGDPEEPREAGPAERDAILALALPRLAGEYRVLEARACYYDVAAEERFVVEPLSPRCVAMGGFSGHGFKFGPLLGRRVAAALEDPAAMAALPGWAAGRGGAARDVAA